MVIKTKKACSVYPLKLSAPLGAVYAILGIGESIPLIHGSQGCAAFAKTFLTRHFSENIPMQTTALSEVSTVIGGDDNLHTALRTIIEKNKPKLIGVVSTGVSETRGDDVEGSIKRFRQLYPEYEEHRIVFVSTPDYKGSFHDGYRKALLSIISTLTRRVYSKDYTQINLLLSYSLTAKDVDILREVIESFGLNPVVFPDISLSLDGGSKGFSSTTSGGTQIEDIERMSASAITIAVGESTKETGEYLEKKFMIPMFFFESLMGVENFDRFIKLLINVSGGKQPKESVKRWRNRLIDAMLDAHFYLSGKRVVVAGEPDTVYSITDFLHRELGIEVPTTIVSTDTESIKTLPAEKVLIGDLEDIMLNTEAGLDLLIGNTNLRHIAKKLSVPHCRVGIPIFDRLGHFLKGYVGYEGSTYFVFELANILMERDEELSYRVPEHALKRRRL